MTSPGTDLCGLQAGGFASHCLTIPVDDGSDTDLFWNTELGALLYLHVSFIKDKDSELLGFF